MYVHSAAILGFECATCPSRLSYDGAMTDSNHLSFAASEHAAFVDALYPRATPEMRAVLLGLSRMRARRGSSVPASAEAARAQYAAGLAVFANAQQPVAHVRDFQIPQPGEHLLHARLYCDRADFGVHCRVPALLYLHGGGFVVGDVNTHDDLCRSLARESGVAVVALDYRRAPEHPFPAAFDDAWAALRWLAAHGASIGIDGQRLAVGGDSAGGTLAAACAIAARDAGLALVLQVLIYPGVASAQNSPSHTRWAQDLIIAAPHIRWFFDQYAPSMAARLDWRFAPLLAADSAAGLDGTAPALVVLAEYDPMVDEGLAYADALRWARVDVQLQLYEGVTHEFLQMPRAVPTAAQARADIAAALKAALF